MRLARCVFSVPVFLGGRLLCNSGALPLLAASTSLCSPGRVFCRFSLLRFVFWFLLLPWVPPICLFLVLPRSGGILSRCLVALPGFVVFVNVPCVLTVASPGRVFPASFTRFFNPCCCVVPLASPTFWRYGVFRFRCFVLRPRLSLRCFL